jgi:hypothetical protein
MVYRGHIERGVVVLDDVAALPDGTQVEVRVESEAANCANAGTASPGSAHAVLSADVKWVGDSAELDGLLAEVQLMRNEDLEFDRRRAE